MENDSYQYAANHFKGGNIMFLFLGSPFTTSKQLLFLGLSSFSFVGMLINLALILGLFS